MPISAKIERQTNVKSETAKTCDYRETWLHKMDFLESISHQHNAVILLFDTSIHQFIYMRDHEKVLGNYVPKDFTSATGMDFYFNNIHPEQRTAALLIQLKIISFGIEQGPSQVNKLRPSLMLSFKKDNGEYIQFLQTFIPVEWDSNGHPLLYVLYSYDVSHLVTPCVKLMITSNGETIVWNYNANTKSLAHSNHLSVQEKKILSLLAEGRGSKEIAEKLFTSSHTIDTHRRNLLKKTNCMDTTALITFSKMVGLI